MACVANRVLVTATLLGVVLGASLILALEVGETNPSNTLEEDVSGAIWDYVEVSLVAARDPTWWEGQGGAGASLGACPDVIIVLRSSCLIVACPP